MDRQRLITLLRRHLEGTTTEAEADVLQNWFYDVGTEEFNDVADALHDEYTGEYTRLYAVNEAFAQRLEARIDQLDRKVHFLKRAWVKYAAAILILCGMATFIYIIKQKEKPSVTQNSPVPVQNDVAPGGNKAILTLADGRKIVLDSSSNGQLAAEGGVQVIKKDGALLVIASSPSVIPSSPGVIPNERSEVRNPVVARDLLFHMLSTPRGGQYHLTLPDGTKVWLNAESTIRYPTAFSGNERKVSITGEAYFEVAHDKKKPFRVECMQAGSKTKQTIEVLGTQFNVNAYTDEISIKTTLIEGRVLLSAGGRSVLTLKPGQQGQLLNQKLVLAKDPDVSQVVAWKNGAFNFNHMTLQEVMQQLKRWYDVEVTYEGKMPQITFRGEMGRDLNLSQVLKALNTLGVKFTIEGKRIIVTS